MYEGTPPPACVLYVPLLLLQALVFFNDNQPGVHNAGIRILGRPESVAKISAASVEFCPDLSMLDPTIIGSIMFPA